MSKKLHLTFVPYVLIAAGVFFAATSIVNDSQIVDEIPHVGAGYSYLVKQDMRLNPEHPPLVKDLAAIPLLFLDVQQSVFGLKHWTTGLNDQWEFGRAFIYNTGNDGDAIKFWSRLPMLLLYIVAAVIMFHWARELYGEVGAMISLVLFLFSPTVLAHTRFVTTDVAALLGVLITTYTFVRYLEKPIRSRMIWAGVALGLALLMKFSTFLLIPYIGVLALAHGFLYDPHKHGHIWHALRRSLRIVPVLAVALAVVWGVYLFHVWNYPPERQLSDTRSLLASFGNRYAADTVVWMSDKPVLRAFGQYLLGFLMVVQRSAGGNTIYFLGEIVNKGGPLYFPLVYLMKETIAWWILVFIAIVGAIYRFLAARKPVHTAGKWMYDHFAEMAMIAWLGLYWFVSIRSTLNIGIRHMLPTFPFAIMLVSGQIARIADWLRDQHAKNYVKAFSLGVALLLGWHVFESFRVNP